MDCEYIEAEVIRKDKGSSFGSLMTGLLIGGLIGAGAALLSTPNTGVENRNMIRSKANEIQDKAMGAAQDARQKAQDMVNQGKNQLNSASGQGQSMLQKQKTKVESAIAGVKQGVQTYANENTGNQGNSTAQVNNNPADQNAGFNPVNPNP